MGGAADGAGGSLGQVPGQQPRPLGVQAAQQSGVVVGGPVRPVLGGAVGILRLERLRPGPLQGGQPVQTVGAGIQQLPGGLGLILQPGQLGSGLPSSARAFSVSESCAVSLSSCCRAWCAFAAQSSAVRWSRAACCWDTASC